MVGGEWHGTLRESCHRCGRKGEEKGSTFGRKGKGGKNSDERKREKKEKFSLLSAETLPDLKGTLSGENLPVRL